MPFDRTIGEILALAFAGRIPPEGYLVCDGSLYSVKQYDALFKLIGTRFGGDGITNFAVPDLRGRAVVGANGAAIGTAAGKSQVTLEGKQMPMHRHSLAATTANGAGRGAVSPAGAFFATATVPAVKIFAPATAPTVTLSTGSTSNIGWAGRGQPHNNMQPYLAVQYVIVAQGLYPSPL